jgi:hypothetical protein
VARLRTGEPVPKPKRKSPNAVDPNSAEQRQRYIGGEYADLIEH